MNNKTKKSDLNFSNLAYLSANSAANLQQFHRVARYSTLRISTVAE